MSDLTSKDFYDRDIEMNLDFVEQFIKHMHKLGYSKQKIEEYIELNKDECFGFVRRVVKEKINRFNILIGFLKKNDRLGYYQNMEPHELFIIGF